MSLDQKKLEQKLDQKLAQNPENSDARSTVVLNPKGVSAEDVVAVARYGATVELGPEVFETVNAVRQHVEDLAASTTPVYGVSTGFGALADTSIPQERRTLLQSSLILSLIHI